MQQKPFLYEADSIPKKSSGGIHQCVKDPALLSVVRQEKEFLPQIFNPFLFGSRQILDPSISVKKDTDIKIHFELFG
jgi:hypothetical protein